MILHSNTRWCDWEHPIWHFRPLLAVGELLSESHSQPGCHRRRYGRAATARRDGQTLRAATKEGGGPDQDDPEEAETREYYIYAVPVTIAHDPILVFTLLEQGDVGQPWLTNDQLGEIFVYIVAGLRAIGTLGDDPFDDPGGLEGWNIANEEPTFDRSVGDSRPLEQFNFPNFFGISIFPSVLSARPAFEQAAGALFQSSLATSTGGTW